MQFKNYGPTSTVKSEDIVKLMLFNRTVRNLYDLQPTVPQLFGIIGIGNKDSTDHPNSSHFVFNARDFLVDHEVSQLKQAMAKVSVEEEQEKKKKQQQHQQKKTRQQKNPKAEEPTNKASFFTGLSSITSAVTNMFYSSSSQQSESEKRKRKRSEEEDTEELSGKPHASKETKEPEKEIVEASLRETAKDEEELMKKSTEALEKLGLPSNILVLQSFGLGDFKPAYPMSILKTTEREVNQQIRDYKDDLHEYERQQLKYFNNMPGSQIKKALLEEKRTIEQKVNLMSVYERYFDASDTFNEVAVKEFSIEASRITSLAVRSVPQFKNPADLFSLINIPEREVEAFENPVDESMIEMSYSPAITTAISPQSSSMHYSAITPPPPLQLTSLSSVPASSEVSSSSSVTPLEQAISTSLSLETRTMEKM